MKPIKSTLNQQPPIHTDLCKIHKEPYSMICLHVGCHSNYKLLCVKCKKQKHYQHPNRTIGLMDFYQMLRTNKLDFVENSLALTLVNIKNKLRYVSNFRIFIMQKESMLMENARTIHNLIHKVLQQKTHLRDLLSGINNETQISDTQRLTINLEQIKKNISFNPIQNVIRINSERVGVWKVELEKYCETTKTVINDIRQYLVKIVQVMIEEQIEEEDIEYIEHEDVDEKIFNINVKKANHIEINQKQTRYKVEQLKEMFDQLLNIEVQNNEQHIENDVLKLEEQIKIKQQIVKNIRGRSLSKPGKYSLYDQILQTANSPDKTSLTPSQIQHSLNQKLKNASKISVNNKKQQDSKAGQRYVAKYQSGSPKSPKIRSITDKGNTCQKIMIQKGDGVKSGGKNMGIKRRTPRSEVKSGFGDQRIQKKGNISAEKEQREMLDQIGQVLNGDIQKIDQSQQEQLLNTDSFSYQISRNPNKTNCSDQSLLLDSDSVQLIVTDQSQLIVSDKSQVQVGEWAQKQKGQKIKELYNKLRYLQQQNKELRLNLNQKIHSIHNLQSTLNQYKQSTNHTLKNNQISLKQSINKYSIDSVNQTLSPKSIIQSSSPTSKNKERKTPQKQQDKLLKKMIQQNAINVKRLMDQKRQLQLKTQKLQKQLKQLREKEINYKKQHLSLGQNVKEQKQVKRRLQQAMKRNQQLAKRNDDSIKHNDELLKRNNQLKKRNDELNKKNDELNKRNDEINKKYDELNKKYDEINKKNDELSKKNDEINKKNEATINLKEQMSRNIEDMGSKMQQTSKRLSQYTVRVKQQEAIIEEQNIAIENYKDKLEKQQQVNKQDNEIKLNKLKNQLQIQMQKAQTKADQFYNQVNLLQNQLQQSVQNQTNLQSQLKQANLKIYTQSQTINNHQRQKHQSNLKQLQLLIQDQQKTIQQDKQTIIIQQKTIQQDKNIIKEQQKTIEQDKQTIKKQQQVIQQDKKTIKTHQQRIEQDKATINKSNHEILELQQLIQQIKQKQQTLSNQNTVYKNLITQNQSIINNHQHLIKTQSQLIAQKQTQTSKLNHETQKLIQLYNATNQQLTKQKNQVQRLMGQNKEIKERLADKISEQAFKQCGKVQQWQQVAEKKMGEKIWLKDKQIAELQERNKLLLVQLNKLKFQSQINGNLSSKQKPQPSINLLTLKTSFKLNESEEFNQSHTVQSSFSSDTNRSKQGTSNGGKGNYQGSQSISLANRQGTSEEQLNHLRYKYNKLEQKYRKVKNLQASQINQHEKMKSSMVQQCQYLKTKYQQQKNKNQQYSLFDINNYVPLLKHKQLKQWYEIAMRKNHQLKQQIAITQTQKSRLIHQYQQKILTFQQSQTKLNQLINNYQLQFNQYPPQQQPNNHHQQSSTSVDSLSPFQSGQLIKRRSSNCKSSTQNSMNQINVQNSPIMLQKYSQISGIIQQITGDMLLLEQKVKENSVIEKVYLKELDRKRTENRKLKSQIDEYQNRERKLAGVKTERYFKKVQLSKGKLQKPEYKVYYATGFAGSESRLSGTTSTLIPTHQYDNNQDKFSSTSPNPSTLSQNSHRL